MKSLIDTLYMARIIGAKDILDALRNKSTRMNIIIMVGMVVFFYWLGVLRPFDRDVSVVVYDEGHTNLTIEKITLRDGGTYAFRQASSLAEMQTKMAYQNLGLALPTDLDQMLASGGVPTLTGYVFWADRVNVAELEVRYSRAFSEILGKPAQVIIGQNVIIPRSDADGMQANVSYLMIYFVFSTALMVIPYLMLEEKQTGTLNALLISPASAGQVVLGKALAGLFYLVIIEALAIALFSPYVAHWGMALAALGGYSLLAVGLGLVVGSFARSARQLGIWMVAVILPVVIPPLFYMESNLKPGIRMILTWFPSSALASLLRFSCSTGVTATQILPNVAIVLVSVACAFGLVIWKVRRSDR
jgi:ABC-2 type transport system permease protein